MTKPRSLSHERNASRATIGKGGQISKPEERTPGPQNYDTISCRKHIGDASSTKICIPAQVRPISSKTDGKTRNTGPGPLDYKTVEVATYKKRKSVIPAMTFSTSVKEIASRSRSTERSPGPSCYNTLEAKDKQSKHIFSATIGDSVREVAASKEYTAKKLQRSPGPADYDKNRAISPGPGQYMARSRRKSMTETIGPGPSDYKYDPNQSLKKNPRITIGNSRESRGLASRAVSPGPSDYATDKLKFLKN